MLPLDSFFDELKKIARQKSVSSFAERTSAHFKNRDDVNNLSLIERQRGYDRRTGRPYSELLTSDEDSNLYRPAMLIPEQPEVITRM